MGCAGLFPGSFRPTMPRMIPPDLKRAVDDAFAVQDYAHACVLIEGALAAGNTDLHLRACHALALGYCARFTQARAQVAQVLADAPDEAARRHWAGMMGMEWRNAGRHDIAEPLLVEALGASDPPAPLFEILADCRERLHRFPEALEALADGLRRFPVHPGLLLVRGRVRRRQGDHEAAQADLRAVINSPLASDEARTGAFYEMGHLREAQGRHAEAFAAFCQAKEIQKRTCAGFIRMWHDLRAARRQANGLPTREEFQRFADEPADAFAGPDSPQRRMAFLVGCPRSGTTLLERVLESHPGIVSASETPLLDGGVWRPLLRELAAAGPVRDMGEALRRITPAQAAAARDRHWSLLPSALEQPVGDRLVLDKNPSALAILPVSRRLHPASPVLMALRDPRALLWSCFTQHFPANVETAAFLELGTAAQHISDLLGHWITLRGRIASPWREVRYEKVVADLPGEAKATLEFLGLPWREEVLAYHERKALVRSPSYAQASRPIYTRSLDAWRRHEAQLAPHAAHFAREREMLGYGG